MNVYFGNQKKRDQVKHSAWVKSLDPKTRKLYEHNKQVKIENDKLQLQKKKLESILQKKIDKKRREELLKTKILIQQQQLKSETKQVITNNQKVQKEIETIHKDIINFK
jgi:hypothetical protein